VSRRAVPHGGKRTGARGPSRQARPASSASANVGKPTRAEKVPPPAPVVAPLLPTIPESVGLQPLTAALLTVTAFLDLAEGEVDPAAAGRVLERVGLYAQRLSDDELDELTLDLERLSDHAREQGWPEEAREFVDNFLVYCGFQLEEEPGDAELDDEDDEDGGPEADER
jgi:hypothetical protein